MDRRFFNKIIAVSPLLSYVNWDFQKPGIEVEYETHTGHYKEEILYFKYNNTNVKLTIEFQNIKIGSKDKNLVFDKPRIISHKNINWESTKIDDNIFNEPVKILYNGCIITYTGSIRKIELSSNYKDKLSCKSTYEKVSTSKYYRSIQLPLETKVCIQDNGFLYEYLTLDYYQVANKNLFNALLKDIKSSINKNSFPMKIGLDRYKLSSITYG